MSKMVIMRGLPASGKSTRAQEIIERDGNFVRINKDLLRTMLHFDKFTGKNEALTRQAARTLATNFLLSGKNVIIDDTNLNPSTLQSWVDLAKECDAKIEHEVMETDMWDCVNRDGRRQNKVGGHVIMGMALQYGLYPVPDKAVVICDLDGTLADVEHRRHFVSSEKKDWKGFFDAMSADTPRKDTLAMLEAYHDVGHKIFFVSARPEDYRYQTVAWLSEVFPEYEMLIMRPAHDTRPDTIVKDEIFNKYFKALPVLTVIDDRPSVIRMWRAHGLNVIDVGNGVEF